MLTEPVAGGRHAKLDAQLGFLLESIEFPLDEFPRGKAALVWYQEFLDVRNVYLQAFQWPAAMVSNGTCCRADYYSPFTSNKIGQDLKLIDDARRRQVPEHDGGRSGRVI